MELTTIIGHVGKKEPEMNYNGDGLAHTHFSVAVNIWVKQGAEWGDETHWWFVTAFGKDAEALNKLSPGNRVYLSGRAELEAYSENNEPKLRRKLIVGGTKDYEILSPRSTASEGA